MVNSIIFHTKFIFLKLTNSARLDANAIGRDERRLQMFANFLVNSVVSSAINRKHEIGTIFITECNILSPQSNQIK